MGGGCGWEEGVGGRRVWVGGGCGWEEGRVWVGGGVGGRRVWVGGGCGWEESIDGQGRYMYM